MAPSRGRKQPRPCEVPTEPDENNATRSQENQQFRCHMSDLLEAPPHTPIDFVTDILHGVAVTDPYRWLEDQNSCQTRKWLEEQAAYRRTYLDSIPGRDRVRLRIEQLLSINVIDTPRKIGGRVFFMKREPRQEQSVIMMREALEGPDIPLVNPTTQFGVTSTNLGIVSVTRDGIF